MYSMLCFKAEESPPSKSVLPCPFLKSTSPQKMTFFDSQWNEILPGECPGVGMTENFPGAGSYKVKNLDKLGNIPIALKFRHGFYYDDEMKKKKATVSMQKYSPKFNYVKINRYKGAGIGFGKRGSASKEETPGPANYDVPRIFDRGVKKDLVIN